MMKTKRLFIDFFTLAVKSIQPVLRPTSSLKYYSTIILYLLATTGKAAFSSVTRKHLNGRHFKKGLAGNYNHLVSGQLFYFILFNFFLFHYPVWIIGMGSLFVFWSKRNFFLEFYDFFFASHNFFNLLPPWNKHA